MRIELQMEWRRLVKAVRSATEAAALDVGYKGPTAQVMVHKLDPRNSGKVIGVLLYPANDQVTFVLRDKTHITVTKYGEGLTKELAVEFDTIVQTVDHEWLVREWRRQVEAGCDWSHLWPRY